MNEEMPEKVLLRTSLIRMDGQLGRLHDVEVVYFDPNWCVWELDKKNAHLHLHMELLFHPDLALDLFMLQLLLSLIHI